MAWHRRYYTKGGFLSEINDGAIERIAANIASAPSPEAEVYVLQLGGAVTDVEEDATAYTGRSAGYYWIAQSGWEDKAEDQRQVAWCKTAAARLAEISMRGNYVNEQGDFGNSVALGAYGEKKYSRLATLKAQYDPANLFRLNQNIEPRI